MASAGASIKCVGSLLPSDERVLIVEDDEDTLQTLADVLAISGVGDVRCATSIAGAQAVLEQGFSPTAIILDLVLEGPQGETFAADLKGDPARAGVPIIAVSGDPQRLGALCPDFWRGYLKPVDPQALVEALDEIWRRA